MTKLSTKENLSEQLYVILLEPFCVRLFESSKKVIKRIPLVRIPHVACCLFQILHLILCNGID